MIYTFGNASAVSRADGLCVIKPSGVPYDKMTPADMVITDLDGNIVEGKLKPSTDLDTHVALYRAFPGIGGIVHTHSRNATSWAQAAREIPCFGTTHADYFHGSVPVTDSLTPEEIDSGYEANTGVAIIRRMQGMDPLACPGDPGGRSRAVLLGQVDPRRGPRRGDRRGAGGDGAADADDQSGCPADLAGAARQASLPEARPGGDLRAEVSRGHRAISFTLPNRPEGCGATAPISCAWNRSPNFAVSAL